MRQSDISHHAGHRKRTKRRYIEACGNGFNNHELMELLLFCGIRRKNTNEIAHSLIERFGSVSGVAEASMEELMLVDGIGEDCAILINLVLSLAKSYAEEQHKLIKRITDKNDLVEYGNMLTFGVNKQEQMRAMSGTAEKTQNTHKTNIKNSKMPINN